MTPAPTLSTRTLGDAQVSAIGLGAMPLSTAGHDVPEARAIATIHAALDAGLTLIDTADAYTPSPDDVGHNERLVARALASYGGDTSDEILVATKGGHTRISGGDGWGLNGSPEYLRRACDASLKALGVEVIGLYQFHRPDPHVPYADSLGAVRELYDAGKIGMAGISNADLNQIRQAQQILGDAFVSVQNQLSPRFRSSEPELAYCAEQGIAFLPWSPLGGMSQAGGLGERFQAFADVAREHDATPQQVCISWLLAKAPVVIPIPGSSRPETVRSSAEAVGLELTAEQRERLDATAP